MLSDNIIDDHLPDVLIKAVALYASPTLVSVMTHNVTGSMAKLGFGRMRFPDKRKFVIWQTGVIIECEAGDVEGTYLSTILAPASLFQRTNGVLPDQIEIDVFESGGKLFKGELLACDFHYNLSAIRILSHSSMPTAIVRGLDDISSIDQPDHSKLCMEKSFQLRPHSSLFKILPGTRIITLCRLYTSPFNLRIFSSVVRKRSCPMLDCKELVWIEDSNKRDNHCKEGPVFNCCGEVIGMSFRGYCFLPSNFVSRWWSHYKNCGEFIRPWLGIEVSNLYEACEIFLKQFVKKFPNITTGVVVTKVEENLPEFCSNLQPNDVIIKCDGKRVRNKLEFFVIVWDNVGRTVELNVLRASKGTQRNKSITIGKSPSDYIHKWPLPRSALLTY